MALPPRPSVLRAAACAAALAATLSAPALAPAHAGHHHHDAAPAASAEATTKAATTTAAPPASHASMATSMFRVADPKRPRIAAGPRGPLWSTYTPRPVGTTSLGRTFAERILAVQVAKGAATDPSASRAALTTAQATKKLTKKCQKLVKITKAKDLKKLKKADRKARTKCLERRRKIIADSKKQPQTTPGTATPTNPSSPSSPGAPTPTNPGPNPTPTHPAPTTPTEPAPTGCTSPGPGDTLFVTAVDEGKFFELSACGLKAGKLTFTFANTDFSEQHNLIVADGFNEITESGQTTSTPKGTSWVTIPTITPPDAGAKSASATLKAGDYWLICIVEGHVGMATKFKVFPA